MTQRVLLCIMDGWGISTGSKTTDATVLADPVNVDRLEKENKFIQWEDKALLILAQIYSNTRRYEEAEEYFFKCT